MPLTIATKNAALDAALPTTVYVSLHSGSTGQNGANEITGGSPAYARKAATLAAAANGQKACSVQPAAHDVPAGTTVAQIGFWDALTGGNFKASYDNTDEAFGSQGQAQVTINPFTLNDVVGG